MKTSNIYRVSVGTSPSIVQDAFYVAAPSWNAANKKATEIISNEVEWAIVKLEEIGELRG